MAIVKSEIFLEMDRRDQQQIVAAMTGEVIDELIYKVKGKTAISWAGINHISFHMGDIEVNEPKETQWERIVMFGDRVYWSATIRARNTKYGLSSLGTAEAPELADTHVVDDKGKWVKALDGSWEMTLREDPHCRRKALSMAQRNGKRAVMPAAVLKKWLEYFLKIKKGETVDPPFQPKYVESTQKIVEKKEEKPKKRAPRKVTKKKASEASAQASLTPGQVTVETVKYTLHGAGIGEDMVGEPREEGDLIVVEAVRDMLDEDHYQVFGALEPMGAVWREVGHFGQWELKKKEKA